MKMAKGAELRAVFSDAHVIDVDFSEWDKAISLVVVADHLKPIRGRLQLIRATFFDVRQVSFQFPRASGVHPKKRRHFQWWISSIDAENLMHGKRFCLCGDDTMPTIEMICGSVKCSRVDRKLFQAVNPGWAEPYSGLARPSVERLYVLLSGKRRASGSG